MERRSRGGGTPEILLASGRVGHRPGLTWALAALGALLLAGSTAGAQAAASAADASAAPKPVTTNPAATNPATSSGFWRTFAAGFATSILAHEGGHVVAAVALGGRPSFGFDAGRPTVYSGIDAEREPARQFVFSSAGLTVQTLIDEVVLDAPHEPGARAGPFERGVLAGGIATTLFYVTIGRSCSVSDVDYMARTSSLSKTSVSAIYGSAAVVHLWRLSRDERYAKFFVRPDPRGGMRVGLSVGPRSPGSPRSPRTS